MELGENRVWDYVGDNFVHRLVQTDDQSGKLVEAEGNGPGYCKGSLCLDLVMMSSTLCTLFWLMLKHTGTLAHMPT